MKQFICSLIVVILINAIIDGVSIILGNKTVEQYCATAYSYNVTNYKACTKLSQEELIKKLTKDFNKKNSIPDLEEIK